MEVADIKDAQQWNQLIENLPGAHVLQTWQWGEVKAQFGWDVHPLIWRDGKGRVDAAALVLQRRISNKLLPIRLSVIYVPKGPLLDWSDSTLVQQVLIDLKQFAKNQRAIFIKIDPDLPVGYGIPGEAQAQDDPIGQNIRRILESKGWIFSDEQIQFRNTVAIDLRPDEEELLTRMKAKTRYNIRLAKRRGVTVRSGTDDDIDLLYHMYAHTAVRDDFLIRHKKYYKTVWGAFCKADLAQPLIAEVEGQPVGAVVIFRFAGCAWYFYGMSLDEHREKMFNHRLQWEAMCHAKAFGCHTYDMWGAPDIFNEDDPLWGVYRFKDGFGGKVIRTLGAWDLPIRPLIFRLYSQVLPKILNWMRQRGKSETKRSMQL